MRGSRSARVSCFSGRHVRDLPPSKPERSPFSKGRSRGHRERGSLLARAAGRRCSGDPVLAECRLRGLPRCEHGGRIGNGHEGPRVDSGHPEGPPLSFRAVPPGHECSLTRFLSMWPNCCKDAVTNRSAVGDCCTDGSRLADNTNWQNECDFENMKHKFLSKEK